MQVIICLAIMLIFIVVLFVYYIHEQSKRVDITRDDVLTHEDVVNKVIKRLADLMKEDTFQGKDDVEFRAIYNRRIRLEKAMTNCIFGIDKDKILEHRMLFQSFRRFR